MVQRLNQTSVISAQKQEPIVRSVEQPYHTFASSFSQISLFLDTHGNSISRENLNSGSHDNYAKLETGQEGSCGRLDLWELQAKSK